jgi:hypothetical protein
MVLTNTEGKVKAFLLDGTKKEEISLASDTNAEILLGLLGGKDERSLKFPLSVGQKWTYQYRWRAPGARETETYYGEVNVIGVEQIATSAGTFKTFRLEQSISRPRGPRTGGRQAFSTTYFFSPDTKSVIKSNHVRDDGGTRDVELIKFGLNH